MAATSPYQNNDYQAVSSFRPYRLPINDIFKAYSAQNQFWDQGAARVKSEYQDALGLNLTLNENKKVRDDFMKSADQQITKLSSMDLSDPSVQRQGIGVFSPLFQDKSIAFDAQLTKVKQAIFEEAETYKNKKLSEKGRVGEGYNMTNLLDALDGFEKFNANTTRNSRMLEQLYKELGNKAYQPYYDYSKEMQSIAKDCKGISTQEVGLNEGYITTISQSGSDAQRLAGCLEYSLSDQAKNQIGIEARRAFKNPDNTINYRAMTDSYNSTYQSTLNGLRKNDEELMATAALYEKQYNETGDKQFREAADFASKQRDKNNERIANLIEGYNKLNLGDMDYLHENYDRLARGIYQNTLIDGFSTAFQNASVKKDIKADPYEMLKYRLAATFDHEKEMEDLKYQHQTEIEKLKIRLSGKKVKADGTLEDIEDPLNPALVESNLTTRGIEAFDELQKSITAQAKSLSDEFYNGKVAEAWERNGGTKDTFMSPNGTITPAGMEFLKKGDLLNDRDIKLYLNSLNPLNAKQQVLNATREAVENDPEVKKLSKDWMDKLADKTAFPDITLSDGTVISAQQMYNAIQNPGVETIPGLKFNLPTYVGNNPNFKVSPLAWGYMTWRGKRVQGGISAYEDTYGDLGSKLHTLYMKVATGNAANDTSIIEKKNKLFGEALLAQEGRVYANSNNTDKEDGTRQKALTTALSAGATDITIDNVKILSKNPKTGRTTIQISRGASKDAKFPSQDELIQAFRTNVDKTADQSKIHTSLSDNTLVVDFTEGKFIDESYKSNPFTAIEDDLSSLALILVNHPTAAQVGKRIEDKKIPLTSGKGGDYFAVPYKSSSGNILYEVRMKNSNGEYKRLRDGLNPSEVISLINN